ncbi:DUF1127 domain-containing protein [Acidisoma sp. C75]
MSSAQARQTASAPARPRPRAGKAVRRLVNGLLTRLRRHARAAALRRELERMDERMLGDLGVSRAQLGFEIDHWERLSR